LKSSQKLTGNEINLYPKVAFSGQIRVKKDVWTTAGLDALYRILHSPLG